MYRQHFGLTQPPLGNQTSELWDDGHLAPLRERFQWLLQSPGIGLLTGPAGVGKTAALRQLTQALNPHRYQVLYAPESDFGRFDLYRNLALLTVVMWLYGWRRRRDLRPTGLVPLVRGCFF